MTTNQPMTSAAEPPRKPSCHGFGGECGGVGKTVTSCAFIEVQHIRGQEINIVDLDRSTPNVGLRYAKEITSKWVGSSQAAEDNSALDMFASAAAELSKPQKKKDKDKLSTREKIEALLGEQIVLSTDKTQAYLGDNLVEIIQSSHEIDTVLAFPSQSLDGLKEWLKAHKINRKMKDGSCGFNYTNWWVSHGGIESMELLDEFIQEFPNLRHVIVFNRGINTAVQNWKHFKPSEALIKHFQEGRLKGIAIEYLSLSPEVIALSQKEYLMYRDLDEAHGASDFVRDNVQDWIEKFHKAVESTGYL